MRRWRLRWTLLLVIGAALAFVGWQYQRDMRGIEAQLAGGARVIQTGFGPAAYATGGQGAPVLAIHGAGGGHDQGALLARASTEFVRTICSTLWTSGNAISERLNPSTP